MSKKWSLLIYIGAIACMILIIFDNDKKYLDVWCGVAIGMNIMLIIDALFKKKKGRK